MVADGFPNGQVDDWRVRSLVLPYSHNDIGNTPRVIGSLSAFSAGYDAVSFLDADNWYQPDHIEEMVDLQKRTGAIVCTSNRSLHRPDGSYMFDDDKNDGVNHVDTNCFFLLRASMRIVARWAMMPRQLSPISDTIYLQTIKRANLAHAHAHDAAPTVCYRTTWEFDFRRLGEPLPEGVKYLEMTTAPFQWFKALSSAERKRIRDELDWPLGLPARARRKLSLLLEKLSKTGITQPQSLRQSAK